MSELKRQPAYTVVLGIADPHQSGMMRREIERHPRFEVVRDVTNAVLTLDSAIQLQPNLVILSDLSPGVQGRDVLNDLEVKAPKSCVIITVAGESTLATDAANVSYTVDDHDPIAMGKALDSTAAALDNPEERPDRRKSFDRRMHQDWTKVFAERRVSMRREPLPEAPGRVEMPYLN